MERKIGEIFKHNGEWYQCIKVDPIIDADGIINYCEGCGILASECDNFNCTDDERSDKELVIFKKLEKVGEPFTIVGKLYQYYKVFDIDNVCGDGSWCVYNYKRKMVTIEIKQKEESMEEKKTTSPKEDNALTRTVYAYINGKISDKELIKSIKEMSDEYPYNKNSLKPFNIEEAKAGKSVCTRDGRKARIICFDAKCSLPVIALITQPDGSESLARYYDNGRFTMLNETECDLMMLPEKKEGWVNVSKFSIFASKEEALSHKTYDIIETIKVSWEE